MLDDFRGMKWLRYCERLWKLTVQLAVSSYGIVKRAKWSLHWVVLRCLYYDSSNEQMCSLILEGHVQPYYCQELLLRLMWLVFKANMVWIQGSAVPVFLLFLFHLTSISPTTASYSQHFCKRDNHSHTFLLFFLPFFTSVIFVHLKILDVNKLR